MSAFFLALAIGLSANALRAAQPYAVVDTSQAKCYDDRGEIAPPKRGEPFYGQDAQFHSHPASYTLSAVGLTVRDTVTGLTWQRSPDTDGDGVLTRRDKLTLAQAQERQKPAIQLSFSPSLWPVLISSWSMVAAA